MNAGENCGKCFFEHGGKCKLHPPVLVGLSWVQPEVTNDDACGQWQNHLTYVKTTN